MLPRIALVAALLCLIKYMNRLNPSRPHVSRHLGGHFAHTPTIDIFVRTCKKDAVWLTFMLRSMEHNVPADVYRQILVAFDESESDYFEKLLPYFALPLRLIPERTPVIRPEAVFGVQYESVGYLAQMYSKFMAWQHTDADYVMHLDSDVIVRRPITRLDLMDSKGRVYVKSVNFSTLTPEQGMWRKPSEDLLKETVPVETMSGFPFVFPRTLYINAIQHIETVHGMPFLDVLRSLPKFNEFTPLGHYLVNYMPDSWVENPQKSNAFEQAVSWDGLTPDIAANFERHIRGHEFMSRTIRKRGKHSERINRLP